MINSNYSNNKPLEKLNIFKFAGIQMRTFHITWITFFVSFFSWFSLAGLMPVIIDEFKLSASQVGDIVIASVTATILARLVIGRLCDTLGPRKTYTYLLLICSLPVFLVGLSYNYTTFLLFRFAIGCIGSAFVLTQFHTGQMFAPKIKGTANAVTGGWGNLGGGVTNIVMPLIFAWIVSLGVKSSDAWRLSMIVPGTLMLICAYLYWNFTKDTPEGNYDEIVREVKIKEKANWGEVLSDWRVWALMLAYALCFGMEITFDGLAATYLMKSKVITDFTSFAKGFNVEPLVMAGYIAGSFGLMNIFARALGGWTADKVGALHGMKGKGILLALFLFLEGIGIILFSQATTIIIAITCMIAFALFLKMANGATYALTPFISNKNAGLVAGIVGAGGNIGGMLMGFLFKSYKFPDYPKAFFIIGCVAIAVSVIVYLTKFTKKEEIFS
jgi:MFS transporter, NNP family, nitrate/nitrite transporter